MSFGKDAKKRQPAFRPLDRVRLKRPFKTGTGAVFAAGAVGTVVGRGEPHPVNPELILLDMGKDNKGSPLIINVVPEQVESA